jgi:hypothetical protein
LEMITDYSRLIFAGDSNRNPLSVRAILKVGYCFETFISQHAINIK